MRLDQILDFWCKYKKEKMAVVGLAIIIIAILIAILAPWICPYDPWESEFDLFEFPSLDHLFGTDSLGRDVFSRMIIGTRISLIIALGVATISLAIGVIVGCISGYFGGIIDDMLSRFTETFLVIPTFFLMILVVALFGQYVFFEMFVIGLTIWPSNAKIARSQVLAIKSQPFVEAALADGAGSFRILFYHILPNGLYPLVINATLQMGQAILLEAGFSFLGLGDPNIISWGQVLYLAQLYIGSAWWTAIYPGVAIFFLVFAFNLVGEGLNNVLNPRLRA
jgi:peptide/nickel transport system permease protein